MAEYILSITQDNGHSVIFEGVIFKCSLKSVQYICNCAIVPPTPTVSHGKGGDLNPMWRLVVINRLARDIVPGVVSITASQGDVDATRQQINSGCLGLAQMPYEEANSPLLP